MSENIQWDSSISFILAMIGSAVGLGNIWRFSYVLYSNGGGSFFIPYFLALALLGIPFLILEYGIGFSFKDSFSNILKSINERFEYLAWILLLIVFLVVCYYMVIISWDVIYFLSSFNFSWGADPTIFFANSVGGNSDISNAFNLLIPTAIVTFLIWGMVWYISHKDLKDGIGKVAKVFIPALFVMMAVIVLYAFTLPGHMIGIYALIKPDWSTLFEIDIWLAACGQILFSLSMGQAIALTYASYLPDNAKLADNVLLVVAANSLFEIFTAFGVFSILGFMSLHSGIRLSNLVTEGTGLVFDVFPLIFNVMGPIARILAPLFFLAIFFAGITSAIGLFEPMLSSVSHKFDLSRRKTASILAIVGCAISLLFTTGIGSYLIGIIDTFANEFGILFMVGLQCVIFGWFYKIEDLVPVLNAHSRMKVGKKWVLLIKYLLPVLIFGMWVYGLYDLFMEATTFELVVDLIMVVVIMVLAFVLTKKGSKTTEE